MKAISRFAVPFFLGAMVLAGCLRSTDSGYDNSEDIAYLEEHAERDDVIITDSGLQYRVIEEGDGDSPGPESEVRVHYTGVLVSGQVFDTSQGGGPRQFNLSRVVQGFSEGIQLMSEGAKYVLVIPAELAYGEMPPPGIHRGATLIFDVELIEIIE